MPDKQKLSQTMRINLIPDVPSEVGLGRIAGRSGSEEDFLDRMESKDLAFHRKVRVMFLTQAAEAPGRFAVVSGTNDVEHVHKHICRLISERAFIPPVSEE